MELGQILFSPVVKGIGCFFGGFLLLAVIGMIELVMVQVNKKLLEMEIPSDSEDCIKVLFKAAQIVIGVIVFSLFLAGIILCFFSGIEPPK